MNRGTTALLCCLAVTCLTASALGAGAVQGRMVSDGVTGRPTTRHGWGEEKIYVGELKTGFGAGGVTLVSPPGWYSCSGSAEPPGFPAGTYALFTMSFDGTPAFSFSNVQLPGGSIVVDPVELRTPAHYSVMYDESWYEWASEPWIWGTDFYQTFIATGPYVTRVATKLAGKGGDHQPMTLNFAIYKTNAYSPSAWTRISPIRSVFIGGNVDPIIWVFHVPYRSNEMELVPGQEYAARFWRAPSSSSDSFAIVARPDTGSGYANGHLYAGNTSYPNLDAYAYVSGGSADTMVNFAPVEDASLRDLVYTSTRFGQTFRASGGGLAAVDIVYTTGDPSTPSRPITFQVYDSVGGAPIGPAKLCYGIPGFYQGRAAAIWGRGDVPLVPGRTYYVEWTTPLPGVNTWKMNEALPGEGYVNRVSLGSADLVMSIAEYTLSGPIISVNPTELTRTVRQGRNLPADSITIRNTGVDTLDYTVTPSGTWLSVDPPSGSSAGETDVISVGYSTASLAVGTYTGALSIEGNATNSPQTLIVHLTVAPVPGDLDGDGDVDMPDFSLFQLCFSGPNRPPGPGCSVDADFDEDGDVDLHDFLSFQACFNGSNRPPACL